MPSDFIYISIPRTGSNSIHKVLSQTPGENHLSIRKISRQGFSFAFVRNPLDLAVSWFYYHKIHQNHKQYDCEFLTWIKRGCPHHWDMGFVNAQGLTHPLNQWEYVCNLEGKIIVDYVGKYDTLQLGFNQVCDKIGRVREQLPVLNGVKHNDFELYYTPQARETIKTQFKKDFELFNF